MVSQLLHQLSADIHVCYIIFQLNFSLKRKGSISDEENHLENKR